MNLKPLLLTAVAGLLSLGADAEPTAETRTYTGIRYAQAERWDPPRPVPLAPPTGEMPACPQPMDIPLAPPDQSENCLRLNVTTPATPGRRRPVLVYLHGGSFNYGAGANYRPDTLVTRGDVVAVTINYRLGPFGFLAHPELGPDAGNLGLADQQAALRWVRDNIAGFGGDPHNVTIMGQSAGGYSVCAHLASPHSAGLFHRAIVQSAGCTQGYRDQVEAEQQALGLAAALGCADAACLRGRTAAELVAASGAGHDEYRPVVGGELLPVSPAEAIATGRFNRVPVLIGGNHDEEAGRLAGLELAGMPPLTAAAYPAAVAENFDAAAEDVLARYPLTDHGSPSEALAAALTDRNWALQIDESRRLLARHVPVYAYEFAERDTPWFPGAPSASFPAGASHMLELPYLFSVRYLTPATQEDLRNTMIDRWTRFARTGDPGWQCFRDGRYVLSLASGLDGVHRTDYETDHKLAFWRER
ncbi:carboxylesterase/lipase family protein [Actinophytocola oryzae]|uniref:Carboxylic ester hydrolase n=1 Tax=Actinophytocola oryzae TaxID=502181 RepID=A0A4R7UWM2_9PSEU|nr:carboxylesterase family protein [Actinophytocola oryzae]TDV40372.1 para-nitrobenzyl esterase [Actinophytocola oryzae]